MRTVVVRQAAGTTSLEPVTSVEWGASGERRNMTTTEDVTAAREKKLAAKNGATSVARTLQTSSSPPSMFCPSYRTR
jgi:hypothetical protein